MEVVVKNFRTSLFTGGKRLIKHLFDLKILNIQYCQPLTACLDLAKQRIIRPATKIYFNMNATSTYFSQHSVIVTPEYSRTQGQQQSYDLFIEKYPNKILEGINHLGLKFRAAFVCLIPVFFILFLFHAPVNAQKIDNKKIWTTYHKTPMVALTPIYSSYSIEYDYGDMVVPAGERPQLPGLEFKKTDGELLLKIRVKGVYSADKELKLDQTDGKQKAYYNVAYKADYGYDLVEKLSGDVIAAYKREGGVFSTPSFSSRTEIDIYLKNALVSDLTKYLIEKVNNRVSYDLVPNKYKVRLVVNSVEGASPAYQEINKATTDFVASLATPEPDKEKLRPLTSVWENKLKKANWDDKKSEINKKVAMALLENLCAAYLLLEDYPKLSLAAELAQSKNKGILSDLSTLTFEIDGKYPGPCSFTRAVLKNGRLIYNYTPTYEEFAGDLAMK